MRLIGSHGWSPRDTGSEDTPGENEEEVRAAIVEWSTQWKNKGAEVLKGRRWDIQAAARRPDLILVFPGLSFRRATV